MSEHHEHHMHHGDGGEDGTANTVGVHGMLLFGDADLCVAPPDVHGAAQLPSAPRGRAAARHAGGLPIGSAASRRPRSTTRSSRRRSTSPSSTRGRAPPSMARSSVATSTATERRSPRASTPRWRRSSTSPSSTRPPPPMQPRRRCATSASADRVSSTWHTKIRRAPGFDQVLTARLRPGTVTDSAGRAQPDDVAQIGFERAVRMEVPDVPDDPKAVPSPGTKVDGHFTQSTSGPASMASTSASSSTVSSTSRSRSCADERAITSRASRWRWRRRADH